MSTIKYFVVRDNGDSEIIKLTTHRKIASDLVKKGFCYMREINKATYLSLKTTNKK